MNNKLIINAAITGMIPHREDSDHVPISADEIIADALAVAEAGASIIHLHARDIDGAPSWDPDIYAQILTALRKEKPDLILCASLSGRTVSDIDKRAKVLDLKGDAKPDMGSLMLGSMNFPRAPSINAPDTIQELAQRMLDRNIKPELEAFEPGMVHYAKYLEKKGLIKGPWYINLILGSLGSAPGDARNLAHMVDMLPEKTIWAAAGIGRYQLSMNTMAVAMDGHVRTGLEDNLYYDQARHIQGTNVNMVNRISRLAAELERPIAKPKEVRALLEL